MIFLWRLTLLSLALGLLGCTDGGGRSVVVTESMEAVGPVTVPAVSQAPTDLDRLDRVLVSLRLSANTQEAVIQGADNGLVDIQNLSFGIHVQEFYPLSELVPDLQILQTSQSLLFYQDNPLSHMVFHGYIDEFNGEPVSQAGKYWASFFRVPNPYAGNNGPAFLYYGVVKGLKNKLLLLYGDQIHQVATNVFQESPGHFFSEFLISMGLVRPDPMEAPLMESEKLAVARYNLAVMPSFNQRYNGLGLYIALGSYLVQRRVFREMYGIDLQLNALFEPATDLSLGQYYDEKRSLLDNTVDNSSAFAMGVGSMAKDHFGLNADLPYVMVATEHETLSRANIPELGASFIGALCNRGHQSGAFFPGYPNLVFNALWVRAALDITSGTSQSILPWGSAPLAGGSSASFQVSSQYLLDAHEFMHMWGAEHEQDLADTSKLSFLRITALMSTFFSVNDTQWTISQANSGLISPSFGKLSDGGTCSQPLPTSARALAPATKSQSDQMSKEGWWPLLSH